MTAWTPTGEVRLLRKSMIIHKSPRLRGRAYQADIERFDDMQLVLQQKWQRFNANGEIQFESYSDGTSSRIILDDGEWQYEWRDVPLVDEFMEST